MGKDISMVFDFTDAIHPETVADLIAGKLDISQIQT